MLCVHRVSRGGEFCDGHETLHHRGHGGRGEIVRLILCVHRVLRGGEVPFHFFGLDGLSSTRLGRLRGLWCSRPKTMSATSSAPIFQSAPLAESPVNSV